MYTPNNWLGYANNATYDADEQPFYHDRQLSMYPSMSGPSMDILVPQRPYSANIQRNHVTNIGPLLFNTPQGRGVRLADIQARMSVNLIDADYQPLEGFGMKVTYRIEWPGYDSFNKQKHALRATRQKQSVSLQKVALHVAEVMKDFIQEMAPLRCEDPTWRVGSGFIDFEDLYLLEVHQVAKASLQPLIAYRPRTMSDSPVPTYLPFYPSSHGSSPPEYPLTGWNYQ